MSENPYVKPFLCRNCRDLRVVTRRDTARKEDLAPCPYCGTPEKHSKLWAERHFEVDGRPEITERDLTEAEREVVRDWRVRGFAMMDCLRWIEGRRYNPLADEAFIRHSSEVLPPEELPPAPTPPPAAPTQMLLGPVVDDPDYEEDVPF